MIIINDNYNYIIIIILTLEARWKIPNWAYTKNTLKIVVFCSYKILSYPSVLDTDYQLSVKRVNELCSETVTVCVVRDGEMCLWTLNRVSRRTTDTLEGEKPVSSIALLAGEKLRILYLNYSKFPVRNISENNIFKKYSKSQINYRFRSDCMGRMHHGS